MDNLKEQIAKILVSFEGKKWDDIEDKTRRIMGPNSKDVYLKRASKIMELLKPNNYYQLQAGEDGLVTNRCELFCNPIGCKHTEENTQNICPVYPLIERNLKAQKALDDKEKVESIRKVFDGINEMLKEAGLMLCRIETDKGIESYGLAEIETGDEIDVSTLKQTLEELK